MFYETRTDSQLTKQYVEFDYFKVRENFNLLFQNKCYLHFTYDKLLVVALQKLQVSDCQTKDTSKFSF